jgi:amino acid transporter
LVVLPLEIVAASITISFWPGAAVTNSAAWVTIFLVVIVSINFFGVRGYGEAEFVFSIIKVTAVIGFIILGIVLDCGGGPNGGYIGGQYWKSNNVPADYPGYQMGQAPGSILSGAFHDGFKGLCSVFVTAAFSFGGTELVGLTAAEADNPRKTLPTAIKQVCKYNRAPSRFLCPQFLTISLLSHAHPTYTKAAFPTIYSKDTLI